MKVSSQKYIAGTSTNSLPEDLNSSPISDLILSYANRGKLLKPNNLSQFGPNIKLQQPHSTVQESTKTSPIQLHKQFQSPKKPHPQATITRHRTSRHTIHRPIEHSHLSASYSRPSFKFSCLNCFGIWPSEALTRNFPPPRLPLLSWETGGGAGRSLAQRKNGDSGRLSSRFRGVEEDAAEAHGRERGGRH